MFPRRFDLEDCNLCILWYQVTLSTPCQAQMLHPCTIDDAHNLYKPFVDWVDVNSTKTMYPHIDNPVLFLILKQHCLVQMFTTQNFMGTKIEI